MIDVLRCIAPKKIYKYRRAQPLSGAEVVTYGTREIKEIEGMGIFTYYDGIDIPYIGVSPTYQDFPKAMAEMDKVKRVLREYLKNPFLFLRPQKTLESFNGFADKCLGQWYLDWTYWCPTTLQIYRFVSRFLEGLGIDVEICDKTAEIVATLFEYDGVYRYRVNDLMSETTKEAMIKHFLTEVKRLIDINATREYSSEVHRKIENIYKVIKWLYWIPRVRRAIIKGLKAVDWKGWQLTESEIFHTLNWGDYDVRGRNWSERQMYYEELFKGKQKPKQIKIRLI